MDFRHQVKDILLEDTATEIIDQTLSLLEREKTGNSWKNYTLFSWVYVYSNII